jgi:hypothetical protein
MRNPRFFWQRSGQAAALAVIVAAVSACATAPGRISATASCMGDIELVVRNNTAGAVDVYRNTTGRPLIATVAPGSRTIRIGGGERASGYMFYAAAVPNEDARFIGFGDRRSGGRVDYEERCLSE